MAALLILPPTSPRRRKSSRDRYRQHRGYSPPESASIPCRPGGRPLAQEPQAVAFPGYEWAEEPRHHVPDGIPKKPVRKTRQRSRSHSLSSPPHTILSVYRRPQPWHVPSSPSHTTSAPQHGHRMLIASPPATSRRRSSHSHTLASRTGPSFP